MRAISVGNGVLGRAEVISTTSARPAQLQSGMTGCLNAPVEQRRNLIRAGHWVSSLAITLSPNQLEPVSKAIS